MLSLGDSHFQTGSEPVLAISLAVNGMKRLDPLANVSTSYNMFKHIRTFLQVFKKIQHWLVFFLTFLFFPYLGKFIIPTDELIRGMAQPPGRTEGITLPEVGAEEVVGNWATRRLPRCWALSPQ